MIGGTVCIPDEQTRLNDIVKAMNDMRVNWTQQTPTFVRFLEPSMVPTLANIVLMGEAMSQANLDTWSKINLVNGYVVLKPVNYSIHIDLDKVRTERVRRRLSPKPADDSNVRPKKYRVSGE